MAQRIYLGIVAGIFIVSGLFAFIDPHAMGEWLGIAAIDVTGETEIRATYGGLVLGKRTSCPPWERGLPALEKTLDPHAVTDYATDRSATASKAIDK